MYYILYIIELRRLILLCIFDIIIMYNIIMTTYVPYLFTLNNGQILINSIKQYSQHKLQHVKK